VYSIGPAYFFETFHFVFGYVRYETIARPKVWYWSVREARIGVGPQETISDWGAAAFIIKSISAPPVKGRIELQHLPLSAT